MPLGGVRVYRISVRRPQKDKTMSASLVIFLYAKSIVRLATHMSDLPLRELAVRIHCMTTSPSLYFPTTLSTTNELLPRASSPTTSVTDGWLGFPGLGRRFTGPWGIERGEQRRWATRWQWCHQLQDRRRLAGQHGDEHDQHLHWTGRRCGEGTAGCGW